MINHLINLNTEEGLMAGIGGTAMLWHIAACSLVDVDITALLQNIC